MRFSIVTAAYNSEAFIRETIDSVVSQKGDFSIQYIVLDNNSTDGTSAIVEEYRDRLSAGTLRIACRQVNLEYICEADTGMYDAITKGFARASGDVYAWINSDDIYFPGAFDIVCRTMRSYPDISWLNGVCLNMNLHSTIYPSGSCRLYRQDFVKAGLYGPVLPFISQESTFWTADLWKKSGGVDPALRLAGDYFLWKSFAKHAPLVSINAVLSAFRRTPTQKSADIQRYFREIDEVGPPDARIAKRISRYFRLIEWLPRFLPKALAFRLAFGSEPHLLVTLENGVIPTLLQDTNYFFLKRGL